MNDATMTTAGFQYQEIGAPLYQQVKHDIEQISNMRSECNCSTENPTAPPISVSDCLAALDLVLCRMSVVGGAVIRIEQSATIKNPYIGSELSG